MEACEVFLDVMEYTSITSASVAKYGLTAIANCTATEEVRTKLMQLGAGEIRILLIYAVHTSFVLCVVLVRVRADVYVHVLLNKMEVL